MNQYVVTRQDALEVASVFMNTPSVIGVELIGSIARKGQGNDLDLVLTVNAFRYASFVQAMTSGDPYQEGSEDENDEYFTGFKALRFNAAQRALTMSPALKGWLTCASRRFSIDLLLMPQGWKNHIDEVQSHLPHRDPAFVSHIAVDAVTLKRSRIGGIVRATR